MSRHPITWLEVFAGGPLQGNLLAVVHDADEISTGVMAAQAARFRLSETSYVQSARDPAASYRHRIFTVAGELPFAGHPSIGTATAVTMRAGGGSADLVQETLSGLQRLVVEMDAGGAGATVDLHQDPPRHLGSPDTAALLATLGLEPSDAHPELLAEVISTGLPTLVVPVTDRRVLGRISVRMDAFATEMAGIDGSPVTCYLVAEIEGEELRRGRSAWRARCFTPQVASGEDAATGSAAGPLAAYAHRHLGSESVEIDQGVEMGSPSQLAARIDSGHVVVTGHVRVVGDGFIDLPEALPGR